MGTRWAMIVLGAAGCSFDHGVLMAGGDGGPGDDAPAADAIGHDAFQLPGAIARWELDETSGSTAADTSNVGSPLDLTIDNPNNVTWGNGALRITAAVRLRSVGAATKISDACRTSGAVTVEAWVTPADDQQGGPARIFTISPDILNRNVMLAQEGATWVARLRTSNTSNNGTPDLATGSAILPTPARAHLVFTADATARILLTGSSAREMHRREAFRAGTPRRIPPS